MAAELEKSFGVQPALIRGGRGVFDVKVDGNLLFSKHKLDRFPDPGEVTQLLRARG